MPSCAHCGQKYTAPIYRNTLCSQCSRELKTCRNCGHFAPGMANDCREPVSEPVQEKDRANFCDWFMPAPLSSSSAADAKSKTASAKDAFANLFGDE